MNYLAHAYLSFNNPDVLLGNMISDFIKGKKQYDYPKQIQAGIQLHRAIDTFTDAHFATKSIKKYFSSSYGLYGGAFADVVYDYFLANDKSIFPDENTLKKFTQTSYDLLENNEKWFGEKFGMMFPYMKAQDWLYNYQFESGIQKSFEGVRRRALYIKETEKAFSIFVEHKIEMEQWAIIFIPLVKKFAADTLAQLLNC
ncbi:MAG: ACP phosphodiesterase [Ferruginibacter sp.]